MSGPRVAVIPAAGRGTRMRPASRVVPKALITVVDRPCIQWAVEEAARAGADEAIVVVNVEVGHLIDQHFREEGPLPGLEDVRVRIAVQDEPRGLGHAVWTAREHVGDRAFFCLLADTITPPDIDFLRHLARASEHAGGASAVTVREVTDAELDRYGAIVPGERLADDVIEVRGAVEKPGAAAAPSRYGLIGRYLFTPEVFEVLAKATPGLGGEIQLTDAIGALGEAGRCAAAIGVDDVLDVGHPLGLITATATLGVQLPEYADSVSAFLRNLSAER